MKVKVRDVHPNPYRNIEHYPLNKEKIMALTNSIEKTGFWDNLVGRGNPETSKFVDGYIDKGSGLGNEDFRYYENILVGREIDFDNQNDETIFIHDDSYYGSDMRCYNKPDVQIAYGHHRIEALRLAEGFGYDYEFDLPVRGIDDSTMIKIMANENMQEWTHSIGVTDETVKVTKKFLESNRDIAKEYFKPTSKEAFFSQKSPISGAIIERFLGWEQTKIYNSLLRLKIVDSGKIERDTLSSLPTELHSSNFARAISKSEVNFTPDEQNQFAKEIKETEVTTTSVKDFIENKAFEKTYGKDFGKKKKEKEDKKLEEFDEQLAVIADKIGDLSRDFVKLTMLKNELESVTTKDGLFNLKILFMAYGNLKTRMDKFEKAMTEKTQDITEEFIEKVKQLKQ